MPGPLHAKLSVNFMHQGTSWIRLCEGLTTTWTLRDFCTINLFPSRAVASTFATFGSNKRMQGVPGPLMKHAKPGCSNTFLNPLKTRSKSHHNYVQWIRIFWKGAPSRAHDQVSFLSWFWRDFRHDKPPVTRGRVYNFTKMYFSRQCLPILLVLKVPSLRPLVLPTGVILG